ncbi:MAG: glycerol-3-phosphate 1-O-acyltransferase PlsY [Spartobacteria bacterium]
MLIAEILLGAYLIGSFPAAYLAGRLAGIDIRTVGSKNSGATNVVRVLGKWYGYPVFAVDLLKGLLAVLLARFLTRGNVTGFPPDLISIVAGLVSVLGHTFPVWLRFKGGKGVATAVGVMLGLALPAALTVAVVWLIVFELTRFVSVASIAAAVALPFSVWIISRITERGSISILYASACLAVLVIIRHRSNISRLLQGNEKRFPRK